MSPPIRPTGVLKTSSKGTAAVIRAGLEGEMGGPGVKAPERFLELGVGDPGSSNIGGLSGLELVPALTTRVGVVGPDRGLPSIADMSRDEAAAVPGDAGAVATAVGISSHSFFATVFRMRKEGHISVSILRDVIASAECQCDYHGRGKSR